MGEDYKNAAETVYFLLNAMLVAMQIREKLKKQKKAAKKPPVNRNGKKRK
ncbi:hypothetical protein [uncultured Phascolarctobacterium sp.]|nr:hypothetical protein [uncultured Phascolarctobacterium sp.]